MKALQAKTRNRARLLALPAALLLGALALPPQARAQAFPVFQGDPVDPSSSEVYQILPGLPLILGGPGGNFNPPVIDPTIFGDVDLVVRAGTPVVGPGIPPPLATALTGVAGTLITGGTEIPFTVIVSDGAASPATGNPLFGAEMDGIPVIVTAWADIDGDGFVGPTNADPAGASDNVRELQESDFVVGRQVAIFSSGLAMGSIAVRKAAPATGGGMGIILGAVAYVGPFVPGFLSGNVPEGPGIATLLPNFPELDPVKVVEGNGAGGAAGPAVRLGFEFEPAFDTLEALALGLPLAIPVDASGITTDRAFVHAGPMSRARFLKSSSPVNFPQGLEVPLFQGAGGILLEPLPSVQVVDDGPGAPTKARLVPIDIMDNVTDPPPGCTATLVAGPGLQISNPDGDQDPARETVDITGASGVEISLDDSGGLNDSGASSRLWVAVNGFPVDVLDVTFTAGGGGPGPNALEIRDARFTGNPASFVAGCSSREPLEVDVFDPQGNAKQVSGMALLDGKEIGKAKLKGNRVPPGNVQLFEGSAQIRPRMTGLLEMIFTAQDKEKNTSDPLSLFFPVVANQPPAISGETLSATQVTLGSKTPITASAMVTDDCEVSRVSVEVDTGNGFRRAGSLRDDGRKGDLVAGDGIFTGPVKLKTKAPGVFPLRFLASDKLRETAVSSTTNIQVVAP